MRGIGILVAGIVAVGVLAITAAVAAMTGFGPAELGLVLLIAAGWALLGWWLGGFLERHASARGKDGRSWRYAWIVAWIVFPVTGPVLLLLAYLVLAGSRIGAGGSTT